MSLGIVSTPIIWEARKENSSGAKSRNLQGTDPGTICRNDKAIKAI
jgi:hypothetical protein